MNASYRRTNEPGRLEVEPSTAGATSHRDLGIGRIRMYIERRDAWIGVYVSNDAVYICPLPFMVIRWSR